MSDDELRQRLSQRAAIEARSRDAFCSRAWCALWDMARERGHPEWAKDAYETAYAERREQDRANFERALKVRESK